jgi:hypothetical protein
MPIFAAATSMIVSAVLLAFIPPSPPSLLWNSSSSSFSSPPPSSPLAFSAADGTDDADGAIGHSSSTDSVKLRMAKCWRRSSSVDMDSVEYLGKLQIYLKNIRD